MYKFNLTRALVLGALAANASAALADPTYHVIVTKVGFPTASTNNSGSAGAGAGGTGGSGTSGSGSSSSGGTTTPTLADCTLPWGGKLASGSSVPAYTAPSVISPANCSNVAVTETCTDGVLSAPTAVQSCAVLKPCTLPWGETLLSNASVPAYSTSAVSYPASCDSAVITESCSDGTLSAPSATQSCEVVPTVALKTVALPAAQAGVAYSYDLNQALTVGDSSFSASNVTWSVVGSLPAGLALSATGVLSGTPGAAVVGADSITIQALYKGQAVQQTYTLNVAPAGCVLPWGGSLGSGQSVTAYTAASVTSPAACSSVAVTETCTNGTLSAPTAVQSCTVAMRGCTLPWGASLASGASAPAYSTSAVSYPASCSSVAESDTCTDGTLSDPTASQACIVAPTVSLSAATLTSAVASTAYSYDLNQALSVGDASYDPSKVTWSVVGGSLPAGVSLNASGILSGTPSTSAVGTANFTIKATYKSVSSQHSYSLGVAPAGCTLPWGGTLASGSSVTAYTASSVNSPASCASVAVSETCTNGTLSAPNALQSCTVNMRSCTLPWGNTLASGQSVAAYSTSAVSYPTSCSSVAESDTCMDGTLSDPSASQSCQVTPTLTLSAATLPTAFPNNPYSYDLNTDLTVGDSSYNASNVSWAVTSGSLPAGISLSTTGVLSGTPTSAGTSNFSIMATYKSVNGQHTYQIVTANLQVVLTGATLSPATVGTSYSYDFHNALSVTGDSSYNAANVTWMENGTLPAGLSFNATTGVLSGTPTTKNASATTFFVQATYKNTSSEVSFNVPSIAGIGLKNYGSYTAWADGTLATSCKAYLTGDSAHTYSSLTGNGVYQIQPVGQAATNVYCDMTNGGYTLVAVGSAGVGFTPNNNAWYNATGALSVPAAPAVSGTWKYADTFINSVSKSVYKLVGTGGYTATRYASGSCTYAHSTTASGACAKTYSDEALTTGLRTANQANGISDNNGNGYFIFTNNSSGYSTFGWCVGTGLSGGGQGGCGNYGLPTSIQLWVK